MPFDYTWHRRRYKSAIANAKSGLVLRIKSDKSRVAYRMETRVRSIIRDSVHKIELCKLLLDKCLPVAEQNLQPLPLTMFLFDARAIGCGSLAKDASHPGGGQTSLAQFLEIGYFFYAYVVKEEGERVSFRRTQLLESLK